MNHSARGCAVCKSSHWGCGGHGGGGIRGTSSNIWNYPVYRLSLLCQSDYLHFRFFAKTIFNLSKSMPESGPPLLVQNAPSRIIVRIPKQGG